MLKLPNVSLVLIETREHELAQLALEDCERLVEFGDVLVFTDQPSRFMRADRRVITVPDWPNKMGWSRCQWQEVAPHMRTSHALCIQWDSWVVDPSMWHDGFLDYDYVGAPWWYRDGMNVGNGGFCLRSTKLMRFLRKNRAQFPCVTDLDDDLLCRKYRPTLEQVGFEWAPENIAINFAFETTRPNPNARHFGFHAAYNFGYGCADDDERLMSRARLMVRSRYMTVTNPYFVKGFGEKHPQIMQRVTDEMRIESEREIV